MNKKLKIKIIQPDDWHVHLREGEIMKAVLKYSFRINNRCVIMPNLETPITKSSLAKKYKKEIEEIATNLSIKTLIPCYLTESLDLDDFRNALRKNIFIGAKLYPTNTTTNSNYGISIIENIFSALEILEKENKYLLIHGEKANKDIDIFDREKYFVDDELVKIRKTFPNLKIILEHVSSKYGADYVQETNNIAGTITPQHLLLTKKDVYIDNKINPHHYCMPVVKNESDLIALRNYACSGNSKFFLGTDSAPHHINNKDSDLSLKPGIFTSPCSLELYTNIFEEEDSLHHLESFTSINGPVFYDLPINEKKITIVKEKWILPEYTNYKNVKIKNFFGGKELNWKVVK